jgi:hypothetical protein
MPKANNAIYGLMPGDSTDTAYVQRYVRGEGELKDIREKGYALTKEGGKKKKYWTAVNQPNTNYPEGTNLVRAPRGDVKENRAVSADSLEIHNKKTNKWSPIRGNTMGGMSGAGTSMNRIEIMPGSELDPKSMIDKDKKERMEREGYKKGGKISTASTRADGCAQRGKTKGRMV